MVAFLWAAAWIVSVLVVIDVRQSIGTGLQTNRVLWLSVGIGLINRDDQAVRVSSGTGKSGSLNRLDHR